MLNKVVFYFDQIVLDISTGTSSFVLQTTNIISDLGSELQQFLNNIAVEGQQFTVTIGSSSSGRLVCMLVIKCQVHLMISIN